MQFATFILTLLSLFALLSTTALAIPLPIELVREIPAGVSAREFVESRETHIIPAREAIVDKRMASEGDINARDLEDIEARICRFDCS